MVHKKHQSKRITTRLREKNTKRAAEKRRKEKRAARLNPQPKKAKKDPGIPNLWPFKEKLLQEIESAKQAKQASILEARERQRNLSLANLAKDANQRSSEFEQQEASVDEHRRLDPALVGTKDNSRKAYFREFKKVLENADVILEVLDARDPLGCRTRNIEKLIVSHPNKRIILILNKIDLIPKEVAEQWVKYLRHEFPTIAFKSSTQQQRTNISQNRIKMSKISDDTLSMSSSLGADALIKLLKNYSRNQDIKTSLTVGVIGYPNVGKSSLINSLKRAKVCGVGSTPGFTKVAQEIHLDAKLKLLDCPGIVFGGFQPNQNMKNYGDVLLRNCIKVELLEDPIAPVEHLLRKCRPSNLMMHYNLPAFNDVKGFLVALARQRGFIKKGGVPDIENVARLVLKDWNSGNIAFYTLPPSQHQVTMAQAELVGSWAKEFNLDEAPVQIEGADEFNTTHHSLRNNAMAMDSTLGGPDEELEQHFVENMLADDDEEEYEELEESMEEDEDQFVMVPQSQRHKTGGYERTFKPEELSIDAQTNRNLKRDMKKQRKRMQAQQREEDEILDHINSMPMQNFDEEMDDDYDFGVLDALPETMDMEEDDRMED